MPRSCRSRACCVISAHHDRGQFWARFWPRSCGSRCRVPVHTRKSGRYMTGYLIWSNQPKYFCDTPSSSMNAASTPKAPGTGGASVTEVRFYPIATYRDHKLTGIGPGGGSGGSGYTASAQCPHRGATLAQQFLGFTWDFLRSAGGTPLLARRRGTVGSLRPRNQGPAGAAAARGASVMRTCRPYGT